MFQTGFNLLCSGDERRVEPPTLRRGHPQSRLPRSKSRNTTTRRIHGTPGLVNFPQMLLFV